MGKKTISFVATDELADWLEEESERRMTSLSSTVQQLLAEMYRRQNGLQDDTEAGNAAEESGDVSEASESADTAETSLLGKYPDAWYEPGGKRNYAVSVPSDADVYDAGETRYYKTRHGAKEALRRWYE